MMTMCRLTQNVISDILQRGNIYEVGGAVRDKLLERKLSSKDRDYLVTGIPYDDLTRILKGHGRVGLVGRSFGVIKFTQFRGETSYTFDITYSFYGEPIPEPCTLLLLGLGGLLIRKR